MINRLFLSRRRTHTHDFVVVVVVVVVFLVQFFLSLSAGFFPVPRIGMPRAHYSALIFVSLQFRAVAVV